MIKKQGTILIVDDNRNILTTVRMLLESIFDGIITIANPNSIPAKLREEHPDVVPVSYTHLTLPTIVSGCRSRWSPYH